MARLPALQVMAARPLLDPSPRAGRVLCYPPGDSVVLPAPGRHLLNSRKNASDSCHASKSRIVHDQGCTTGCTAIFCHGLSSPLNLDNAVHVVTHGQTRNA